MVTEVRLTVDRQQVTSQITRFWVSAARQRFAAETAQIGGYARAPKPNRQSRYVIKLPGSSPSGAK
jgi:hypothetical protein